VEGCREGSCVGCNVGSSEGWRVRLGERDCRTWVGNNDEGRCIEGGKDCLVGDEVSCVGTQVGRCDSEGSLEGKYDGVSERTLEGKYDGASERTLEGKYDGASERTLEGKYEGFSEGTEEGFPDGKIDGGDDGCGVFFLFF
jgi:hypothetical protein